MVCSEEKWHFFNFNTDSRISLCVRAPYLKYVKGTHQSHQIAFLYLLKNNDFAEIKVPLINRKQVPLHNTVLILCDEGDGLVAVPWLVGQYHVNLFCVGVKANSICFKNLYFIKSFMRDMTAIEIVD